MPGQAYTLKSRETTIFHEKKLYWNSIWSGCSSRATWILSLRNDWINDSENNFRRFSTKDENVKELMSYETCPMIRFFRLWLSFQWPSSWLRTARISLLLQPCVFLVGLSPSASSVVSSGVSSVCNEYHGKNQQCNAFYSSILLIFISLDRLEVV